MGNMKIITAVLLLINTIVIAQVDTTMYGLRGYEDLQGNTQLFYRMKSDSSTEKENGYYRGVNRNDIYHFDINNNVDSLFILDFIDFYEPLPSFGHTVSDFEFVDNTLTDFYQCGDGVTSFEPSPVVIYNREYDNTFGVNSFHGTTYNLEISKVNSKINVYVSASDGVYTDSSNWGFDLIKTTENYRLVSINKNQPNIMFVENEDNYLFKSNDTGATFYIVDSLKLSNNYNTEYINRFFLYDSDNSHIYRVGKNENQYYLQVSNNSGELNSWENKFESESELFISYDSTKSGLLYIATSNEIFKSNDYGETFELFGKVKQKIKGIYKKPNSDLIYITTSHLLLEKKSDSTKILKQLIDYNALNFYPLQVGNTWVYKIMINDGSKDTTYYDSSKVTGIENISGLNYYIIDNVFGGTKKIFIDSSATKLFEYRNGERYLVDSLSCSKDDIWGFNNEYECNNDTFHFIFDKVRRVKSIKNNIVISFGTIDRIQELTSGIGPTFLQRENYNAMVTTYKATLVYAKINSKSYGDSTLVAVNKSKNIVLQKFALEQNYPNPFNPATTIKYSLTHPSIPSREWKERSDRGVFVTLKVYDILGKVVATLVNQRQKPGSYEVMFDASKLSSGIYFYQLKSGNLVQTKKMLLIQ